MASGRLVDYLGGGIIADRPASLDLTTDSIGLWWATDTEVLSVWDGSTWEDVTSSGSTFRGALVSMSTLLTGINATGAGHTFAWDTEVRDTDGIHSNVTNNSRLTVPSGVSKVRLSAGCSLGDMTGGITTAFAMMKNGARPFYGNGSLFASCAFGDTQMCVNSAVLDVTPGDYFEMLLVTSADTSIAIGTESWFQMEIIE